MSRRATSESFKGQKEKVERNLPPDNRSRADDARRRLGVDPEVVNASIKVTSRFRESGLSSEDIVEILSGDESEDSRKFVTKYQSISRTDLEYVTLEEIAIAAGITTRRLWEVVSGARLEQSPDVVKLQIANSMPRVIANAIKRATEATPILDGQGEVQGWRYGDMKATEYLGKISGLLPQNKPGIQIFNNIPQLPSSTIEIDDGIPLPSMDSALKEFQHAMTTPQLPAPTAVPPVDVEYVDVEVEG